MPVKYWSSAGLLLTYWCNARCASCYVCCGPDRGEEMSVDEALGYWRQLMEASPHGCRVHLSGGEPFGDWPRLIELCRRAMKEGLSPLTKIETNAFWASDEPTIRRRLGALAEAGMRKICISADPYHQQFVPIDRCRMLADIAEEMLGPARVQVRWRDWLREGFDTAALDRRQREALFRRYEAKRRDRLSGRAARLLGGGLQRKPAREFADTSCKRALLLSKHVHIDGAGRVMPGTCAGIVLGLANTTTIAELWRRLDAEYASRPIVGALVARGPVALLEQARQTGYMPADGYADKCQMCWDVRRHLALNRLHEGELAPAWMYGSSQSS